MIQKNAVGDYFECSRLSRVDLIGAASVGLLAVFLASVPALIQHYHLAHAQELLLHRVDHAVREALSVLDSLSFTNTVVTFLFWGVVGIVIYGFVTVIVRFWQSNELYREIASGEYVHPNGFSKSQYWRLIIEKELFAAALLAVELAVVSVTIFWAFPGALAQLHALLGSFSVSHALFMLAWVAGIGALFCLGRFIFKAWQYRHILFVV